MPAYQLLCFERGRVVERLVFDAEDDAEALALFVLRNEQTDCELWCGDRLVARIPKGHAPMHLDDARAGSSHHDRPPPEPYRAPTTRRP